jgi:hypothetical protein
MTPEAIPAGKTTDHRAELVGRILRSRHFHKTTRLREFLLYVTDRVLNEPGVEIHEHEIASNVFRREFDPRAGDDTLVRVQASQLRKRLERYFANEGRDEAWRIEIPMGNYAPVFRQAPIAIAPPARPPGRSWRRIALMAVPVLALSAVAAGIAFRRGALAPPARSYQKLFWSQLFRANQRTDIVLADSNLAVIQDILDSPAGVLEYSEQSYWGEVEKIANPELRRLARRIMGRRHTSFADAVLSHRILAAGGNPDTARIVFARDFPVRNLQTNNVILIGSKRSNPWSELLEAPLNFRLSYEKGTKFVQNRSPQPGEPAVYPVIEGGAGVPHQGYCLIAFLKNAGNSGNVLILAGTEMEGTEAGGEFVLSEQWLSRLHNETGLKPDAGFPHFEVLLRTSRVAGASLRLEFVAHRIIK